MRPFGGSLAFALLASLGSIPWLMVVGPLAGAPWAVGSYSLAAVVVYLVWIAPSWSRGLMIGAPAAALALGVALAGPMPAAGVVGAALILAVGRSGFLYAARPARALAVEGLLAGGGLALARALAGSSLLGLALGFWAFFLVQSLFFLAGGTAARPAGEPRIDPFDAARRRAMTLMEEPP